MNNQIFGGPGGSEGGPWGHLGPKGRKSVKTLVRGPPPEGRFGDQFGSYLVAGIVFAHFLVKFGAVCVGGRFWKECTSICATSGRKKQAKPWDCCSKTRFAPIWEKSLLGGVWGSILEGFGTSFWARGAMLDEIPAFLGGWKFDRNFDEKKTHASDVGIGVLAPLKQ